MQRGLVERATDREDRRRAPLRLTPKGRTVHAQIVPLALDTRPTSTGPVSGGA